MKARNLLLLVLLFAACSGDDSHSGGGDPCMSEMHTAQDQADIAAARATVEEECPCEEADSAADYTRCAEDAARAGADFVQVREKDLEGGALLQFVRSVMATGVNVIVNDRVDVVRGQIGVRDEHVGMCADGCVY